MTTKSNERRRSDRGQVSLCVCGGVVWWVFDKSYLEESIIISWYLKKPNKAMVKERIKKKKRNNDIFESSSGISEAWCLTGMEAPFPKGIQSVDINRLSVDTRDVSWLSLVCDRWEDRFRILLLVSLISTLTPFQIYVRESTYASEQRTEERKETEREREKERWLDEKSPTTDREQISDSIWNATNPVDRVYVETTW